MKRDHFSQPTTEKRVVEIFDVHSGDFHAIKELDPGTVPLISCGDTDNGLVGYYDIPDELIYERCVTVAYNGSWPLLSKFHPYRFGAKDDVAVLIPRTPLNDATLMYVAAFLNRMTWRYSYGRKCFQKKLCNVPIALPTDLAGMIDEAAVSAILPSGFKQSVLLKYQRALTGLKL